MLSRYSFWIIFFTWILWASSTSAGLLSNDAPTDLPYHIKADSLAYDDNTKTYRARGHVTVTKGDQSLQSDAVDLNTETGEAVAWGQVYFTSGEDWLTGTRIEINLDAGIGTLYDGTLFIQESHFYIKGNMIEKVGQDTYYIDDGRLTTCDGDSPAWEITGKDLDVTIEGYGTVKHATLWAKSVPVLYAPFLVFPVKIKRQTGLLVPQVSYSNRDGFEYNQPFFWAISESSDATFYEHYMAHRGFKHGVEYRFVLAPESKGTVMYDFLYDRQIDDGTIPQNSTGYHYEGFRGDDENRLNRKRWWFRMKSDQDLPAGFKAKLDVDLVSDQDYLREFDSGYSSYEDSDIYFLEEFGRGLDDQTDLVRLNQLNLNRNWDHYSLNADIRWYDDVITRKHDRPDGTQQNLPSVAFTGSKQRISDSPLYFDVATSFDHFWRDVGTRGYRTDLYPRVYYPISIFKYFDFEPSVGMRETLWQAEEYEPKSAKTEDQLQSREIYDLKGDLSTEVSRLFNLRAGRIDKIRHAIRPQVVYEYVPTLEQEDLPDFVGTIDRKNLVTYSVTNNFTARVTEPQKPGTEKQLGSDQASILPKYRYYDFCRIKFTQSYDIIEARQDKKAGGRRPFSNVTGEIEFKPSRYLDLEADAAWSPYDGEYKSYNAILALSDDRGDRGSVDYRYTQDSGKSILTEISVKLFDPFSAYWEHERNLKDGQEIKSVVGFKYERQCWSLSVSYTHDRTMDVREYFFEISLYGLGEFELGKYRPGKGEKTWKKG
ncbi:MAG: LPS-assembly protein LptD [Deltaproteobacteria bacterium]|nr:LPS-assembly protein LptD [Deltaproteobacteria bacterium]MBW2019250.1 LPS-assembly protein LptD [Deltaproteobacteria bacterium]MBW2074056.1 LPS-assembly protein LptD [Deltaproteobacteria bacterium]